GGVRALAWRRARADAGVTATGTAWAPILGTPVPARLVVTPEYYTPTRSPPVASIARASTTGHGTNVIQGLAVGMKATAAPVLVIAAAIGSAHMLAGIYGIAAAAVAMLSVTGAVNAVRALPATTDTAGRLAGSA